jgi:FkbM family methyltransferase
MTVGRKLRDWRHALFYGLLLDRNRSVISMGNAANGCGWQFNPTGLTSESVVYTGGVGNDITFEHALVKKYGCTVVLVDPSPTGIATMAKPENQSPHFRFFPVGLAARPGNISLSPPPNPEEGSWFAQSSGAQTIQVPCTDLRSLMAENQHSRIDLLKLDIEGSEYEVIDSLLKDRIPVRQLCVEFHHGMLPGIRRSQSIRMILRLKTRGYRLLDQDGNNHTFFWSGKWP